MKFQNNLLVKHWHRPRSDRSDSRLDSRTLFASHSSAGFSTLRRRSHRSSGNSSEPWTDRAPAGPTHPPLSSGVSSTYDSGSDDGEDESLASAWRPTYERATEYDDNILFRATTTNLLWTTTIYFRTTTILLRRVLHRVEVSGWSSCRTASCPILRLRTNGWAALHRLAVNAQRFWNLSRLLPLHYSRPTAIP